MTTSVLKPVSTRSALLTVLLGAEVPSLSARELVAVGSPLGFTEPAVRVALSRMTATGDVLRDQNGGYRLSERLLERQRRQEQAIHPSRKAWRGQWEMVVVTATGRSATQRAELRTVLSELRLAELREGVWTRPANLRLDWPTSLDDVACRFTGRPAREPTSLAAELWELDAWATTARSLLTATDTTDPVLRFTACATSGRHLLDDPVLPAELVPAGWPGEELREAHLASRRWLIDMRRALALV